jgi:hypothetical protein
MLILKFINNNILIILEKPIYYYQFIIMILGKLISYYLEYCKRIISIKLICVVILRENNAYREFQDTE